MRDNAVGALGRLVLAFGATLPLGTIVPAIMSHLPLRADPGENTSAVRCLMRAAQDEGARAHLAPHLPQLLVVLGQLLATDASAPKKPGEPPLCSPELQVEIREFLGWLLGVAPAVIGYSQSRIAPPDQSCGSQHFRIERITSIVLHCLR